jgi:simple sugar transport system ATP-binding protein
VDYVTLPRKEILVHMKGIVKRFPGVLANDHVNFELEAGEVHGLLGENGAGKTTLMNVLYGILRPEEGEIYIQGERVDIGSPREAINLGIGMVHQHFKLVEPHTVLENILLGLKEPAFILNLKDAADKVLEIAKRYELPIDPKARIWQLSMGERQRVEILKALYRGANILVLDEPTSVLTPPETKELFRFIGQMAREGRSVVFITHKLDEVMAASDRVTVLRAGKNVDTLPRDQLQKSKLASMMVGREVLFTLSKSPVVAGEPVLEMDKVTVMGDKGFPAVKNLTLAIRKGEMLGVAGIAGNGQRELTEAIAGMRPIVSGQVLLCGKEIHRESISRRIGDGIAYIPEDRVGVAAPQGLTVAQDLVLRRYREKPFSNGLFLNQREIERNAESLIREFKIMVSGKDATARTLSGGNLQKLILARELSGKPRLIVAVYPTRGLDVGATEYVRSLLLKQREEGAALLMVSEDLDEILSLSDKVAVMYGGEIVGTFPASEADVEEIGLMMGGSLRKT